MLQNQFMTIREIFSEFYSISNDNLNDIWHQKFEFSIETETVK